MPGSPEARSHTRWLLAAVAVLVVLGVAGVVTLRSLESAPRAGEPDDVLVSPSAVAEFGPAPDLCDRRELFAPVFEIVAFDEVSRDVERTEHLYQRDCTFELSDDGSLGGLRVYAVVDDSDEFLRNMFRDHSGSAAGYADEQVELGGDWDEGVVMREERGRTAAAYLVARDGVLFLSLRVSVLGDTNDVGAQEAALVEVAEGVREAMRR